MNFKELLSRAKNDDLQAKEAILERYKSLLLKEAIIDGIFDEDLCHCWTASINSIFK